MSKYSIKRPRLTLKAAKAIVVQELGTAAKLMPHENNCAEYQRYEMRIGTFTAVIEQAYRYPGLACVSFAGVYKYYDIATLQEDYNVTDKERRNDLREQMRDMIYSDCRYIVKALVDEYGLESCREMLNGVS